MVACECSGVILADYSKGKLTSIFGDGGNTDGAEGGNCTELPQTPRPVIPFEGIFKRAA
jgi:hypothetical protein